VRSAQDPLPKALAPRSSGSQPAGPALRRPLAGSARQSRGHARESGSQAPSLGLLHLHRPGHRSPPSQGGRHSCATATAGGARAPSPKAALVCGRPWPRPTPHRLRRLSGIHAPGTSPRSCPELRSQFVPNRKASCSHAGPDCPPRSRLLKHRLLPPPPQRPPGAWLRTRKRWPRGLAGPASPWGRSPWRLPCALCVRPATRAELSFPHCHGRKSK
jgi:hypothetical protein